ncbi:hypothetical protein GCM10027168_10580 [Streptomyces capparidis]
MSRTDDTHAPGGRIVVGVDGSEPSTRALRWALRQAELTGGVVDRHPGMRGSHQRLGESTAPFTDAADAIFGGSWAGDAVAVAAIVSGLGALNGWTMIRAETPNPAARTDCSRGPAGRPRGPPAGPPAVTPITSGQHRCIRPIGRARSVAIGPRLLR